MLSAKIGAGEILPWKVRLFVVLPEEDSSKYFMGEPAGAADAYREILSGGTDDRGGARVEKQRVMFFWMSWDRFRR